MVNQKKKISLTGIWSKDTTRSLLASTKVRRKTIATAVNQTFTKKKTTANFLFEPLEPRILLSADGVVPIAPEVDLLDVVSDADSTDANLANVPEFLSNQIPDTEAGTLNPEPSQVNENTATQVEETPTNASTQGQVEIETNEVENAPEAAATQVDFVEDTSLSEDPIQSSLEEGDNTNENTQPKTDELADGSNSDFSSDVDIESYTKDDSSQQLDITKQSEEESESLLPTNIVLQVLDDSSSAEMQIVFVDSSIDGYEDLINGINANGAELSFVDAPDSFNEGDFISAQNKNAFNETSDTNFSDKQSSENYGNQFDNAQDNSDQIVVYFIDAGENGIEKITENLATHKEVDAVHIISHGYAGAVNLGNSRLTNDNVSKYKNDLVSWGESLDHEADILFYGCEVGANQDGMSLLSDISEITGADVAASDDDTGNALLDGDYDLEINIGEVQSEALFAADAELQFAGLLAPANVTFVVSSGNNAISIINDGTDIVISDGDAVNDSSTVIADVQDITITGIDNEADTLTIDLSTEFFIDIDFDGGTGAGNSIQIIGGADYDSITYIATSATAGTIELVKGGDSNTITYNNVDVISDTSTADDRNFVSTSSAADEISIEDAATAGETSITSTTNTFADITFANPTESLTIDAGDGDDTITIASAQDTALAPSSGILVDGGAGSDTLSVDLSSDLLIDINFDGGSTSLAENDAVAILNGSYTSVVYSASDANANSGEIEFNDGTPNKITYSNTDAISDGSTATDRTFVGTSAADDITLIDADNGTVGQTAIKDTGASKTFVDISFNNPSGELSIQSGQDDDQIRIAADQDSSLAADIKVDGGEGSDTLSVSADLTATNLLDIDFDGGTQVAGDSDSVAILSGAYSTVEYSASDADAKSGDIQFSDDTDPSIQNTLTYSNTSAISDESTALNRTFVGTSAADDITLVDADNGTAGKTSINDTGATKTFADISFNNPSDELSIQSGQGDDQIKIATDQDSTLTADIKIDGGEGSDTLSVSADLTATNLLDIDFDGGTQIVGDSDSVAILSGTYSSVVYSASHADANSGDVEFFDDVTPATSNTITYSNTSEVSDNSDSVKRTFIATDAADEITIVDADNGSVGLTRIQDDAAVATFADVVIKGPSEFLSIQSGDGADTVKLESGQDAGLAPVKAVSPTLQNSGVLIDTGDGADTVIVDGDSDFIVNVINGETLTINGVVLDESSEIDGLQALITFLTNVQNSGHFSVELPLSDQKFGSVSGITEVFQKLRTDLAADSTARGDLDVFLSTWSAVVASAEGDITISTTNVTDTTVKVEGTEFEVNNSLEIDATRTVTVDIDNTEVLANKNIDFTADPANPNYTVDIEADLDFRFGTNNNGFYTEFSQLNANYTDSTTTPVAFDGSLQIGVLGADITGTALNLDADIAMTFDDPNGDGAAISKAELDAVNADTTLAGGLVDIQGEGEFAQTIDFTPNDSFAPTLAGTIQVGGDGALGNGNSYDIFGDYAQGAPVDLMSKDLHGISLLSAEDLLTPLNEFAQFLERLTDSGLYDGNLLLVDGARIGDLLDYTELLRADVTSQVTDGSGDPTFNSIQGFEDILDLLDPNRVNISYDSVARTLGVDVSLSKNEITEADFDYNIILESLEELEALSTESATQVTTVTEAGTTTVTNSSPVTVTDLKVTVDTTLGLDFKFEFNLQTVDEPVLKPSSALASVQTGQLANNTQFELTIGTNTDPNQETQLVTIAASATADNTSLADLIVDINSALDASFTATVTASLDESQGSEFPLLSFSSGATPISVDSISRTDTGIISQDFNIDLVITETTNPGTANEVVSEIATHTVTLLESSTSGNTLLTDLVADINNAIDAQFGAGVITAALDSTGQQIELSLDGAPANQALNLSDLDSFAIVENQKVSTNVLGLAVGSTASTQFSVLDTLPNVDISGGSSDIEFALELDANRTANFTIAAADTTGFTSANDLLALFNAEFTGIDVTASVESGRLVIAADDGSGITSLRLIAESDNPILTVLGFTSGEESTAVELAPAFFDTNEASIDATVRTSFSQGAATTTTPGTNTSETVVDGAKTTVTNKTVDSVTDAVTGRYGFVDIDFTEVAAQSTMTLNTSLMDSSDDQVDLTQLNDPLGSIVDGPVVSGALSDDILDGDDYVVNDNLRSLVTASAGDIQFAVYLDGYAAGESQIDDHRLTVSATLPFAFGESDLGLENESQSVVSGQIFASNTSEITLTGDASFDVTIGGTDTLNVTITPTADSTSLNLVSDINSAIAAEITRLTDASSDNAEILRLQSYDIEVSIVDGSLVFQESNDLLLEIAATNTVAEDELNLTDANGTERLIFTSLFENPAIDTEGRPRADAEFALQIDNNPAITIKLDQLDTSDNIDLIDLVADINTALGLTTLAATVEARVVASRLAFVNLGAADTKLSVSAKSLDVEVSGDSRGIFTTVNADIVKDALSNFSKVLEQTDFAADATDTNGDQITDATAFLQELLPIIGKSGLELNDYITAFGTFVGEVNNLNVESLQDLERGINELMGLDHSVVNGNADTGITAAGINFDFTGTDSLGIDLVFQQETETEFDFFVDAYGLASFVGDNDAIVGPDIPSQIADERVVIRDPLNAVELVAESIANVNLNLDVDLSSNDPQVTLLDSTNVDLNVRVHEDELNLGVKVGSAALFVQDGSVIIDADGNDATDDYLTISTDFEQRTLTDSLSVTAIDDFNGGDFEVTLDGQANIELPLFQNASNTSALSSAADSSGATDAEPINFQINMKDLIEMVEGSVEINDPDNLPELTGLVSNGLDNLLSDPSLLIDGLDNVLAAIQTRLQLELSAIGAIPLIGDQIQDAIQPFFDDLNQARIDLNDFLLSEYAEAVTSSDGDYDGDLTLMLREALYDLFADSGDEGSGTPSGINDGNSDGEGPRLGLLQDLASDGNANVGFEDILLNQFNDTDNDDEGVQYDFHLGQKYQIKLPFDIGLNLDSFLPGIGFDTTSDEGVVVDMSWDLRLGFGISTQDLFYINTVHFNDISDAGSGYAEELQLAVDVSIPGFEADVNLGLVGAEITDGVQGNATISTNERIPIDLTGIQGGEFNLILYTDTYDSNGNLTARDTIGEELNFVIPDKSGPNPVTAASALLLDLNAQSLLKLLVTPDLSEIELTNPSYGLSFQALDPDVTRIEYEYVDGNHFGLGNVVRAEQGQLVTFSDTYLADPSGYVLDPVAHPNSGDFEPIIAQPGAEFVRDGSGNIIFDGAGDPTWQVIDPGTGLALTGDFKGEVVRDGNGNVFLHPETGEPIIRQLGIDFIRSGVTHEIKLTSGSDAVTGIGGLVITPAIDPAPRVESAGEIIRIESQFEDSRATGLGFVSGQTAIGGEIVAEFEAPTDGVLNQDVLFVLTVDDNGTDKKIEVSVRANSLKDAVDNPDADNIDNNGDESVDGLEAFVIQIQDALDLALGEAGLAKGDVELSLTSGSDTFTLEGAGLTKIEFSNEDTSFASLKFAVDLFGDVPEDDEDTPFDPLYDFLEDADEIINTFASKDDSKAPNLDRPRLTLPELASSPNTSIYVTVDADAEVRLHVETNTNNIDSVGASILSFASFGLPSINFDLKAGAEGSLILFGQVDPEKPADEQLEFSFDDIDFDNIQIDVGGLIGSFLGPALDGINTVLGPVFDLLGDGVNSAQGFLNEPIPILSDIAGLLGISDDISFLDLTGNKDSFNAFFDAIEQISKLTDAIAQIGNDGTLNLGGLRVVLDDESPFYFPKFGKPIPIAVANVYDSASTAETSLLQILGITADGSPIPDPGGFKLDLLAPSNVFKLLTGGSFDIFSFNLPKLELELGIDFGFDFDVLAFEVAGGASIIIDLGIGYDSTGLERIKTALDEGSAVDPLDMLDGFFIRTIEGGGPEISFNANFSGGGSVDVHTPSFCIDLGILGSICFPRFDIFVVYANLDANFQIGLDIIDPNEDGKLRFNEILDLTNEFNSPQNLLYLFDITASGGGSFAAGGTILGASLSLSDLGLGEFPSFSLSAQDIFGSALGFSNPFKPIVAEVLTGSTGVIRINAGEFAYARIYGDTNDYTGSSVTVRNINANTLRFTDNTTGSFTDVSTNGISSIIFRGVDAADYLDASGVTSNISFDVRGNGGNDNLTTGNGSDVILGGTGDDRLNGGGGSDSLFGQRGSDTILGGSGTDLISGGNDDDTLRGQAGGDRYLFLSTDAERNGFGKDTIDDYSEAYSNGRILAISSVQRAGTSGIQVTSEGHGLSTGQTVVVTGVVGISNANGTVTVTKIDDDNFTLNGRTFGGGFNGSLGGGYIVDTNAANLDATRSPKFNELNDTVDLTNANSSQSLLFTLSSDTGGNAQAKVSFVDEEVAINTVTHNGTGIETFLGGSGNDTFDLSHSATYTNIDGIEGSDKYIVRLGDDLGDVNVQDTGVANATDSLFVFGTNGVDTVGLTNSKIVFDSSSGEKTVEYAPEAPAPAPAGTRLESGLEVIQVDLRDGDDVINIESTPSESTVTINGGLGSDVFKVGVNASTGAEQNLNLINGTEENGPLRLFGNDESPTAIDNAADIDQLEVFDTTDTVANNSANNNAGILGFNKDTGVGKLEGLGIAIAVEFGGVETVDLTLGKAADELLVLGTVDGNRTTTGLTTINASSGKDKIDLNLSTAGVVTVNAEEDNDQVTLLASADSGQITINGEDGDDEINITALSALASVTATGSVGRDTFNFGSKRSNSDNAEGSLNGIDGTISIVGGADLDTLNVDDSKDTAGNNAANSDSGVVTSSSITGLGMDKGIGSYTDFEQVYIYTGSGNDEVNIQSTDVDAVTLLDTNAGDDEVQISSNATLTGNLDNVQGDVVIHGGNGNNSLLISDLSTATADANVVFGEGDFDPLRPYIINDAFTANAGSQNHHFITGFAGQSAVAAPFTTGTIYYSGTFNSATGDFLGQDASKGGVTVFAGDQGNTFQIDSVYSNNLTTLHTGDGDDTVTTAALSDTVNAGTNPTADGELLIYGEDGADIVDASLSDVDVTLDGGKGDDILFSGNADDLIVGGEGADYIDGGDGKDVIYGDSAVTLDLAGEIITRTTEATGGNDFLIGAGGDDEIHGELADDVIFGDNVASVADPATGEIVSATSDPDGGLVLSTASSTQANGVVRITSSAGTAGKDEIFGDDGNDIIAGGLDEDTIQGNAGEDTIFGDNAVALFTADADASKPLTVESSDTDQGGNDTIFGDSYIEDQAQTDLGLEDAQNDTDGAADVIFGGIGDDAINSQAGDDVVFGDNGIAHFDDGTSTANDLLSTAENDFGADTIHAGVGDDVVLADHGDVTRDDQNKVSRVESTFLTGANDKVVAGSGNDQVIAGAGSDEIDSGNGDDIVLGDFGSIEGNKVATSDSASGGEDTIVDSSGDNIIFGGAADDNITTGDGNDIVLGDSGTTDGTQTQSVDTGIGGNDTIVVSGGNNQVIGGAEEDNITTGKGNDIILGDSGTTNGRQTQSVDTKVGGRDTIVTSGGSNQVIGGAKGDNIRTGNGNDIVLGDSGTSNGAETQSIDTGVGGSDTIASSGGNNQVVGGAAGDIIRTGGGQDNILGDNGVVTATSVMSEDLTVGGNDQITSGAGNDNVIAGIGDDNVDAGAGNDIVLGDNGRITYSGNKVEATTEGRFIGGNDYLRTNSGNDVAIGGEGVDVLDGNLDQDILIGDNGRAVLLLNPDGSRSIESIDNVGTGPLDPSVMQALYDFDKDKTDEISFTLPINKKVETNEDSKLPESDSGLEDPDTEPRRIYHHNAPKAEVQEDEATEESQAQEESAEIESVEIDAAETEGVSVDGQALQQAQPEQEALDQNLASAESKFEPSNELDTSLYLGAASLALSTWTPRVKRQQDERLEDELLPDGQSTHENKRMAYDFEQSTFVSER